MLCFASLGVLPRYSNLDGSFTYVALFPVCPFENLRPSIEVVGQKGARLLGRFGAIPPLHLDPATFVLAVVWRGRRGKTERKPDRTSVQPPSDISHFGQAPATLASDPTLGRLHS